MNFSFYPLEKIFDQLSVWVTINHDDIRTRFEKHQTDEITIFLGEEIITSQYFGYNKQWFVQTELLKMSIH